MCGSPQSRHGPPRAVDAAGGASGEDVSRASYAVPVSKELVQILVAVIAALALLITKIVETRQGRRSERSELASDVALLKELPSDSTARDQLRQHIDDRIIVMTSGDGLTRHWFGIVMSLIFLGITVWLAWAAWNALNLWWAIPLWVLAVVALIIFIAGLATSAPRRKRGPNGTLIKE